MATGVGFAWPYGNHGVLVVLTDRRLFFLKSGRKTKMTRDFPLAMVTFVEEAWGGITVVAGRERVNVSNMNHEDAKAICDSVARRISGQAARDDRGPWTRRLPWQRQQ